tara:strand:+ start:177 stop:932 length:756 start_codon:yes stop_codon:yes gene_type:complete
MNQLEEQLRVYEVDNPEELESKIHSDILSILEDGLYFSLEYEHVFRSFRDDNSNIISLNEDVNMMFPKGALLSLKSIAESLMIAGYCKGSKEDNVKFSKFKKNHEGFFKYLIDTCDMWLKEEIGKLRIDSIKIEGYTTMISFTSGDAGHRFPLRLLLDAQQRVYYSQRAGYARGIINEKGLRDYEKDVIHGLNISANHLFNGFEIPKSKDIDSNNFWGMTQKALNQHNSILLFIPEYIEKWEKYYNLGKKQ